jgi:hypothetical protein
MSLIRTSACLAAGLLLFAAAPDARAQNEAAPIYGAELMTEQEQQQYREQLSGLKGEERARFRKEHRQRMQERARERGVAVPSGPAPGATGRHLMTEEEREAHRQEMRSKTSAEERERARKEHHEQMKERAREQGIELPEKPPAGGRGPGGPGRGPGGRGPGPKGR